MYRRYKLSYEIMHISYDFFIVVNTYLIIHVGNNIKITLMITLNII